ncbi:MAG: hypothetical protein ACFE0J_14145 [Elainellaceae cyanobacterium]
MVNSQITRPISSQSSSPATHKSIFQSNTVWGAVLTAIAAVSPIIAQQVEDYQTEGRVDPHAVSDVVIIMAGTTATILGRMNASSKVYTPKGMPGPNRPDDG